jgi:hypothetical protein
MRKKCEAMSNSVELNERIGWLERKMVQVLWLLISVVSGFFGWVVTSVIDAQHNWLRIAAFVVVWLVVGWFLQRHTFKGAPDHIQFIDP